VRRSRGTASNTVSVAVTAPPSPTVSLSASPANILAGATSTLTWSSANATACTASGGWSGARATSGSDTIGALSATTSFTLTCTGPGGTGSQSVSVTVSPPTPQKSGEGAQLTTLSSRCCSVLVSVSRVDPRVDTDRTVDAEPRRRAGVSGQTRQKFEQTCQEVVSERTNHLVIGSIHPTGPRVGTGGRTCRRPTVPHHRHRTVNGRRRAPCPPAIMLASGRTAHRSQRGQYAAS